VSTPANRAVFHLMVGTIRDSSERRGTFGAWRYVVVMEGVSLRSLNGPILRSYESEISFGRVLHWTNCADIPGWLNLAEARSESRPGKARRYAVKCLDTDLHRLGTQCHLSRECHFQYSGATNITSQGRARKTHRAAAQEARCSVAANVRGHAPQRDWSVRAPSLVPSLTGAPMKCPAIRANGPRWK
jgi:hypothetical protein